MNNLQQQNNMDNGELYNQNIVFEDLSDDEYNSLTNKIYYQELLSKNQEKYDEKYHILQKILKEFGLKALELGMNIRQNQLSGYSDKSGKEIYNEWFDNIVKSINQSDINKLLS